MRKDKEYGSFLEIRAFSEIFKIKIIKTLLMKIT